MVYNAAMEVPLSTEDVPEAYTEENPRLTYLHLGIRQLCFWIPEQLILSSPAAVPDREP